MRQPEDDFVLLRDASDGKGGAGERQGQQQVASAVTCCADRRTEVLVWTTEIATRRGKSVVATLTLNPKP